MFDPVDDRTEPPGLRDASWLPQHRLDDRAGSSQHQVDSRAPHGEAGIHVATGIALALISVPAGPCWPARRPGAPLVLPMSEPPPQWCSGPGGQLIIVTGGETMNLREAVHATIASSAAVVLLGACSATEPSRPASSSTSTATTVVPRPADLAKERATAAYLGMWQDMADAAVTSDWQSPKLAQNATADALSRISRGLYADHFNGLVTKGHPINHPTVESVEPAAAPTTVNLVDCGDDSQWLKYRADTGQPANDGPSGRRHINAMVKKAVDGSWKVVDFAIRDVGTC